MQVSRSIPDFSEAAVCLSLTVTSCLLVCPTGDVRAAECAIELQVVEQRRDINRTLTGCSNFGHLSADVSTPASESCSKIAIVLCNSISNLVTSHRTLLVSFFPSFSIYFKLLEEVTHSLVINLFILSSCSGSNLDQRVETVVVCDRSLESLDSCVQVVVSLEIFSSTILIRICCSHFCCFAQDVLECFRNGCISVVFHVSISSSKDCALECVVDRRSLNLADSEELQVVHTHPVTVGALGHQTNFHNLCTIVVEVEGEVLGHAITGAERLAVEDECTIVIIKVHTHLLAEADLTRLLNRHYVSFDAIAAFGQTSYLLADNTVLQCAGGRNPSLDEALDLNIAVGVACALNLKVLTHTLGDCPTSLTIVEAGVLEHIVGDVEGLFLA